ncbi:hypothetical protein [Paenibacillus wenxiniae]|uniref:Tfp pilus assembly protein PilN n=1 Tax=Paenibacillus wenxiniae TaxID=1636843 RepID=A0ABW4RG68_9BACL
MEGFQGYSPPEPPPKSSKMSVMALVALILAGLSILGCMILTVWNIALNVQVADLRQANAALQRKTTELTNQHTDVAHEQSIIKQVAVFNYMSHSIEEAVVTDDFIVDKITFTPTGDGELKSVLIDIENQPDIDLDYNGDGTYTLSKNELRTKMVKLIQAAREYYGTDEEAPEWNESTLVTLTVKNYDIGDYADSKFLFVDEY